MKNLIVQLWGIGNLVATEPLMRALGSGDILVDPGRSTNELALLFPKWRFCGAGGVEIDSDYDDTYLCYPVDGRQFAPYTNRLHFPVWSFKRWEEPEWEILANMAGIRNSSPPKLRVPDGTVPHQRHIAISIGYYKGDGGWTHKHWGTHNYVKVIREILRVGFIPVLMGNMADWDADGQHIYEELGADRDKLVVHVSNPLWVQTKFLAGCAGYLGNDTGFGHLAGAFGMPSAIFTVADRIKVRTAAPKLLQFGKELAPEKVVGWLMEELMLARARKGISGAKEARARAEAEG